MFELRKWEPFKDLSTFQKEMDEFFKRTFSLWGSGLSSGLFRREMKGVWCPDIDCYTKDNHFMVKADLPGVNPKDVDITVTGNMLSIRGERKSGTEEKKGDYIYHETAYGAFERTLTLPDGVDTDNIHASFKNGVLEVTMPAKAGVLPKKVKVDVLEEGKEGKKAA